MPRTRSERLCKWLGFDLAEVSMMLRLSVYLIVISVLFGLLPVLIALALCETGVRYLTSAALKGIFPTRMARYEDDRRRAKEEKFRQLLLRNKTYRIPAELSNIIIAIIAQEGDMVTLVALSCTCRVFQTEAERHIYRHIETGDNPKYDKVLSALSDQPVRWDFVRSMTVSYKEEPPCLVNVLARFLLGQIASSCKNLLELDIRFGAELWLDRGLLAISPSLAIRSYKTMCSLEDPIIVAFINLQPEIRVLWLAMERLSPTGLQPIEPFDETFLPKLTELHGPAQQVHAIAPGRPLNSLEVTGNIPEGRWGQQELWKAIAASSSSLTSLKLNIDCKLDAQLLEDIAAQLASVKQLHIVARSKNEYSTEEAISWADGFMSLFLLEKFEFTTQTSQVAFHTRQTQQFIVEAWGKCSSLREVVFVLRFSSRNCWAFDGEKWIDPCPPPFSFRLGDSVI